LELSDSSSHCKELPRSWFFQDMQASFRNRISP
jgi:hypothetical protein